MFAGLSKLWEQKNSMMEIQTRLAKIRSDAAECRLLSNLVTDEKREVFARTAEHLIDLALEVEKTIATNSVDIARAGAREEVVATEAAHHQRWARQRRMLPWLLFMACGATLAAAPQEEIGKRCVAVLKRYGAALN